MCKILLLCDENVSPTAWNWYWLATSNGRNRQRYYWYVDNLYLDVENSNCLFSIFNLYFKNKTNYPIIIKNKNADWLIYSLKLFSKIWIVTDLIARWQADAAWRGWRLQLQVPSTANRKVCTFATAILTDFITSQYSPSTFTGEFFNFFGACIHIPVYIFRCQLLLINPKEMADISKEDLRKEIDGESWLLHFDMSIQFHSYLKSYHALCHVRRSSERSAYWEHDTHWKSFTILYQESVDFLYHLSWHSL